MKYRYIAAESSLLSKCAVMPTPKRLDIIRISQMPPMEKAPWIAKAKAMVKVLLEVMEMREKSEKAPIDASVIRQLQAACTELRTERPRKLGYYFLEVKGKTIDLDLCGESSTVSPHMNIGALRVLAVATLRVLGMSNQCHLEYQILKKIGIPAFFETLDEMSGADGQLVAKNILKQVLFSVGMMFRLGKGLDLPKGFSPVSASDIAQTLDDYLTAIPKTYWEGDLFEQVEVRIFEAVKYCDDFEKKAVEYYVFGLEAIYKTNYKIKWQNIPLPLLFRESFPMWISILDVTDPRYVHAWDKFICMIDEKIPVPKDFNMTAGMTRLGRWIGAEGERWLSSPEGPAQFGALMQKHANFFSKRDTSFNMFLKIQFGRLMALLPPAERDKLTVQREQALVFLSFVPILLCLNKPTAELIANYSDYGSAGLRIASTLGVERFNQVFQETYAGICQFDLTYTPSSLMAAYLLSQYGRSPLAWFALEMELAGQADAQLKKVGDGLKNTIVREIKTAGTECKKCEDIEFEEIDVTVVVEQNRYPDKESSNLLINAGFALSWSIWRCDITYKWGQESGKGSLQLPEGATISQIKSVSRDFWAAELQRWYADMPELE